MAGVWTAAGLQGHDGASNSLSRSLSSLMAADENGHPSTVYLRSNMPPSLRYSVGSTLEREPAYPSETVLPLMRQSSAPTPKFEKLLTNSSSSVQYMGKKIIREYQSAFVLPDKQTVTVTRVEIFFPEQAKAEVTINLAVGSEREVPVSYMRGPPKVARRRIRDYLQHNSWASAMLASSESRDAELLGRMGSKYSDTICRRSRLERSESRKSRQEVVIAQQASSDEEDFDQGSMSEEDLKDKEVEYSTRVEGPTRPRSSVEYRVYREENSFNAYRTRQHSAVSEPEFSRAPVIAHAEPPGKRVIPMSDITSKQNFKELRRQWDERIAEEIRKSSDEWINYSSQRPTKIRDQRSPQSSVVTPAYPARYDRTEQNIQSFSPRTSHTLPPSLPASQFPEADPMRSGKTVIVERDDFGPSALSPTSVISEPSTERGEKETQFIYNQRLLRFNRGEVNRLDATRQAIPTQAHKSTKSRQPQRVEQAAQRVQRGESLPVRESDMEKPKLPPQVLPEDYEWLGTLDRRSQPATYFDGLKQFQTVEPLPSVPARLVPVSPGISQKSAEQFERERQKIPAIDHKESFVRRPNRPQSTPAFRTSSGTDESPLPSPPPTPPEYRDYTRPHSSPDRFINKTREEDMRTPKNLRQKQWIQIRSHSELETRQVNVGVADSYRSVELPVMIDMLRDKKRNNQSSDRHLEDKNKSHLMPSDSMSRPVSGDFKPGSRQRQSSRFLESNDLERLLAPDPYRKKSKDSNGSVEPGQPVTSESSSRPPMVKMKTVDINAPPIPTRHPTANGGSIKPVDNISSKPKNIRKRPVQRSKSDMDKYLDARIEKAYSEEIVRRASVKSEGDADKRNGSISSLSELAEYEEQVSKQWERFRDKFRALSREGLRDHSVPSGNVDLKGQTPSDGPPTDTSVREPPHHITTDPPQPNELRKAERGTRESRTSKLPVPIDSWKSPAGSGSVRVITDDAKHSKNEFKRPDRSGDDKCKSTAPNRPQKRYSVRGQPVPLKTELVRQDKNISAGKDRHPPSGSETTEGGKDYHLGYADSQVRDQHHPKSVKGMPSGGTESPRPKPIGHPSSDGGKQIHGVRPSPRHGEEKARYYPDSGEDGVGKAKIAKSPEPIYSQSGSGNVPENKGETVPRAPGGKGKKAFDSDRPSPRSDQMAEEAAPLTPQRLIKRPADQNRRRESGGPERLVPPKLASEESKTERVKPGRLPFDASQTHRRAEGCSPLTDRHPPKSVEYEKSEQGKPTFRSARGSKNREQLPTKAVDDEKTRKPESGLPDKADDGRFRSAASTRSSHGDLAPSGAIASRSRYSPEGRTRSKPEKPLSETGRHKIHEPTVAENVKSPHDPTATSTDVSGLKQGDTGSERKPFISRIGGYIRDHTHMFDKLPQRKHQKDREENEQFNDSAANDSVKVSSTSPPSFKPISDRLHPQKRRLYEEIDVNQDQKIKRPSSMEPGTRMTPRSTDGKMQSGPVGRPRHPPPPTSPNSPRHRVARRGDNVKENRPPSPEDYRLPGSKGEPPVLSDGEPDEYNLLTQFNQKQFSPKKPVPPRESYGSLTKGPRRKRPQPDPGVRREDEVTAADETRRAKQRHSPPPKSSSNRYQDPQDDLADERRGSLVDSEPMAYDDDPEYINFPPYSFPAAVPNLRDEDLRIGRVQESSEQSSYDPRLGDIFIPKFPTPRLDKEKHSKKTKKEPQPRPPQEEPKPQLPRTGSRTSKRYQQNQPNVPPRGETAHVIPLNKPKDVNRDVINDFDDDDDDLEESEEDLKPPALRIIPQTRSDADAFVPSDRLPPGMSPGTVVTLRHPHKQYLLANRQHTSPHGSLISPTGPSLQSSQGGGSMVRRDDGQHHNHHSSRYRPEQFNPSHYDHASRELDGREHASRPRTKRTTATSRDSDHHRHHGSKHSLVISTKRRTLSGVTGANPIKFRSNSMNALWFGDHPIPSSGTLSPAIPVRLSTIQLQAQAELERRERSTSRGHSMDRRSGISLTGTESRISRPNGELEPYQGIGYGYDARGRMIHGGAPLHARAASRKRRLHDGHESLSRVWIPDTSPTRRTTTDRSPSPGTHLDKRQANLNNSAVAFALKDFTAPGVRANTFCPGREEPSEDRSEDMAESLTVDEHIYARPESLFSKTVNTRKSPLQPPPLPARRQSQQVHGTSKGTNGLKRSSTRSDLSTKSWQRPSGLSRPSHYRRPHLVPNRWGSVPLPKPDQYDSIVHLSTRTLDTDISKRNRYLNYQLESNV